MVGVIESGDFDILLGNDVTRELDLTINVKDRAFSYRHPLFGR